MNRTPNPPPATPHTCRSTWPLGTMRTMLTCLWLLVLASLSTSLSQNTSPRDYFDNPIHTDEITPAGFATTEEAYEVIQRITAAAGIAPNFLIYESSATSIAAATTTPDGDRVIYYNPEFMRRAAANDWIALAILAHEIGHHVNGHLPINRPHHEIELEADVFSGNVLARLGATLGQAQAAVNQHANEVATRTHPARRDRLAAIERGWRQGGGTTTESRRSLQLTSTPEGATVIIAGQTYGITPTSLEFPTDGPWTITFRLAGYDDHTSDVTVRPGHNHHAVTLTATHLPVPPTADCMTPGDYLSNAARVHSMLRLDGGTLRLCEGVFEFPGTITIGQDTYTSIVGAGQGRTVLKLRRDARVVRSGVLEVLSGAQVEIRDLTIEGHGIGGEPRAALDVSFATIDLTNVTLRSATVGLQLSASDGFAWGATRFESLQSGASCDPRSDLFLFVDDANLPSEGSRERRTFFLGCEP